MQTSTLEQGIIQMITKAETEIPSDVIRALKRAVRKEKGIARIQLETILENSALAKKTSRPVCQDTGIQTFFITVGTQYPTIGQLPRLIERAVKKATTRIPLRPNTVDPFTGKNHQNNLGIFHPHILWDFRPGSEVHITVLPKGSGSENMSRLGMLPPNSGMDGIKTFVVDTVQQAGGKPCPPIIVGVGIGGSADLAMTLGKRALLRPVGLHHTDRRVVHLEKELLAMVNATGIGPMGLGGNTTALDMHVEVASRHPASLPVGVIIQCWADRRASIVIHANGRWDVK